MPTHEHPLTRMTWAMWSLGEVRSTQPNRHFRFSALDQNWILLAIHSLSLRLISSIFGGVKVRDKSRSYYSEHSTKDERGNKTCFSATPFWSRRESWESKLYNSSFFPHSRKTRKWIERRQVVLLSSNDFIGISKEKSKEIENGGGKWEPRTPGGNRIL